MKIQLNRGEVAAIVAEHISETFGLDTEPEEISIRDTYGTDFCEWERKEVANEPEGD